MSEQEDDELRVLGLTSLSAESVDIYGLTVPASFSITLYRAGDPFSATLLVRVDPEHGPLPQGILVNATDGTKWTYKDAIKILRGAPVDELLHQAVLSSAHVRRWGAVLPDGPKTLHQLTPEELARVTKALKELEPAIEAAAKPPARRRTITKKLLEEVATVYRSAVEKGRAPTQAVADHFEVTHASAARWVREARKAGTLGASIGPTGGEAPTASE